MKLPLLLILASYSAMASDEKKYEIKIPIKYGYFGKVIEGVKSVYRNKVAKDCSIQFNQEGKGYFDCEYPFGEVVDKSKRKLTEAEIEVDDVKYAHHGWGPKKFKMPIYMSRSRINGTQVFTMDGKDYSFNPSKDFLGKQFYKIAPSSNGTSLMMQFCSIHPGVTIYGDEIDGSVVVYYKPHRVRHDEESTASFKIKPGKISFDSMSICAFSKISFLNNGKPNIELLKIVPRIENVKWSGVEAKVTKVKTVGWLGDFGKVLGTVLGPLGIISDYVFMKSGLGITGLSGGLVNDALVKYYVNKEIVPGKIEEARQENVNSAAFEKLVTESVRKKVDNTGYPGQFLKGVIFSSNLSNTLATSAELQNEIILSAGDRFIKACSMHDFLQDKVAIAGYKKLCSEFIGKLKLKFKPFSPSQIAKDKGCYDNFYYSTNNSSCHFMLEAGLTVNKSAENIVKPIWSSVGRVTDIQPDFTGKTLDEILKKLMTYIDGLITDSSARAQVIIPMAESLKDVYYQTELGCVAIPKPKPSSSSKYKILMATSPVKTNAVATQSGPLKCKGQSTYTTLPESLREVYGDNVCYGYGSYTSGTSERCYYAAYPFYEIFENRNK